MTYPAPPRNPGTSRVRVDSAQFWAGGVATAVVAALIAVVGILITRWIFSIPILAPAGAGAWGNAHTAEYALAAAAAALVAACLLYLLVLGTPQPTMFFDWILGLATLAAVVYPFSTSAPLDQKAATAVVNLVLGIAITSLLTAVAVRSIRRPAPPGYRDEAGYGPEQGYGRDGGYGPGQDYAPGRGYVPGQRGNEQPGNQPTQPINVPHNRGPRRY